MCQYGLSQQKDSPQEVVPVCAHKKAVNTWEMKFWNGRTERFSSPAVPFCAYDKSALSL